MSTFLLAKLAEEGRGRGEKRKKRRGEWKKERREVREERGCEVTLVGLSGFWERMGRL